MRRTALIAIVIAALPAAGCASLGSTAATGAPSSAPVAAASSAPCTTRTCIVVDAKGLKGTVAKDNAVMTKVTCKASTVKQVVTGTYTVHCTIAYSDGMVARGIASVLTGKGEVDWEPTAIISGGT